MAKTLIFVGIFGFLVAATLSFPSIEDDQLETTEGMQGSEPGNPELVIKSDDLARGDLTQIGNLFNFSSYLVGRPPNATAFTFIPLITILSGLTSG